MHTAPPSSDVRRLSVVLSRHDLRFHLGSEALMIKQGKIALEAGHTAQHRWDELKDHSIFKEYERLNLILDTPYFYHADSGVTIRPQQISALKLLAPHGSAQSIRIDRLSRLKKYICYPVPDWFHYDDADLEYHHVIAVLLRFVDVQMDRSDYVICHKQDSQVHYVFVYRDKMYHQQYHVVSTEELEYFTLLAFKKLLYTSVDTGVVMTGSWNPDEMTKLKSALTGRNPHLLDIAGLSPEEILTEAILQCV